MGLRLFETQGTLQACRGLMLIAPILRGCAWRPNVAMAFSPVSGQTASHVTVMANVAFGT